MLDFMGLTTPFEPRITQNIIKNMVHQYNLYDFGRKEKKGTGLRNSPSINGELALLLANKPNVGNRLPLLRLVHPAPRMVESEGIYYCLVGRYFSESRG